MMSSALEILDEFFTAFMRGDTASLSAFVYPDCVFSEPESLPTVEPGFVRPDGLRYGQQSSV
jgi:ketosteroid isomerase-like protein